MANSDTEICNMALSHLATAKAISDVWSERSAEANACRMFYHQARTELLRMRWWPFASQIIKLDLVDVFKPLLSGTEWPPPAEDPWGTPPSNCTNPRPCRPLGPFAEWKFAYRYPSNCIDFRRVLSGIAHGADNRQTRIPFRLGQDGQGKLIYLDLRHALGEYTLDVKDVSRFSPDFVSALSYRVASYIAPRVTAGDPFKLGPMCVQLFQMALSVAGAAAFDEEQPDLPAESEFVRSREDITGQDPLLDPWSPSAIIREGY